MNSLITKVPGSVTDDTLSKYDEISFEINLVNTDSANDRKVVLRSSVGSASVRIVGNGHFTDSTNTSDLGKTMTFGTANTTLYLSNGSYILFVEKLPLGTMQFFPSRKGILKKRNESLAYSKVTFLNMSHCSFPENFTLKDLKCSSFINASFANSDLHADLSDLAAATSATTLSLNNMAYARGNIAELGPCVSLNSLYINSSAGIVGELKDLLDAMVDAGRTSGTLSVNGASSGVTYNGSSLSLKSFTFSGSGWSENT